MKYGQAELYNVYETLSGPSEAVIPETAQQWLRTSNADGSLGGWGGIAENGLWMCRIPDTVREHLNGPAQINALQTTGGEIRFLLPENGEARIVLNAVLTPQVAEVWSGPFFRDWSVVGLENTTITVKPPELIDEMIDVAGKNQSPWHPSLIRVRLPWRPPCRLVSIEGDILPAPADLVPSKRYLAYGSSITHGNASVRPSAMWASRLAQKLGVDLVNLGFGGGAHLEEEIAAHIASRTDWDFGTFELGINVINHIDEDEFTRRVDRFIDIIVEAHREKPLFFIDLFTCRYDYDGSEINDKIGRFRGIVKKKVDSLKRSNVRHVDGSTLLTGYDMLAADLVHPSPAGMETIAANLLPIISGAIGE